MAGRFRFALAASALALLLGSACSEPTAPDSSASEFLFNNPSSVLLTCPTSSTETASGLISAALGGTVSVGGHSVTIPAGALLSDATVSLTVPASKYVEVELEVNGSDHFLFQLPVVVSISYDRCSRSNIFRAPLTAWYIDSQSKALLEHMGGIDNKLLRTVTFTTPHFSAYAVAE